MSEKVLFDANSFITPHNTYYAPEMVPSYWEYLSEVASQIVLLDKVYDEVTRSRDSLSSWLRDHKADFCYLSTRDAEVLAVYGQVIQYLDESPLYQQGARRAWADFQVADPWLIAAAKVYGYKIVTFERGSLPNKNSPAKNPKIPVVGEEFGVECEDLFSYLKRMKMVL